MPTVLRQDGFRVVIYPNDHAPTHVHAIKAEGVAVIFVGNDTAEPTMRESYGMNNQDKREALEIVKANQAALIAAWRDIHG